MKKMYLAIFLIVLAAFVFAGCLNFSNSFETSTTTDYYEDNTTDILLPPENEVTGGEQNTLPGVNATEPGVEEITSSENSTGTEEENTSSSSGNTPAPSSSEYDYLKSGSFAMKGKMIDKTGLDSPYEVAITPDSIYMLSDFSGVPMGMLIADDTVYMVYPEKKAYLEFSDSIMKMAGLDLDELTSSADISFGSYGNLSDAKKVSEAVCNGHNCKVYHFDVASGESRVYMDGTELIRLATYDSAGKFVSSIDVDTISGTVPAEKRTPPSGYKAYKGVTGMMSFMTLLEGIME